ncbi:MAG: DUF882 domain-containing protein, partial [Pseudolabrys sp.]
MSLRAAFRLSLLSSVARMGARVSLAGLLLVGGNDALQNASAEGDTRTLSFYNLHTRESLTVTFKRNGRYDDDALKKLDWFMRDWRKEEQVRMNPHLFDLLWETYREVGGKEPIEIICGYRSPATNSMLRARSSGVAQTSLHTQGHAIDFHIPGVALDKVRAVGLQLQRGGVGFYPSSGSPFIHMDTGTVRHWPRMTTAQLTKVFPDGRTVHVPSDGPPLPGYALALAEVEARGSEPSSVSLAAARDAGIDTAAAGKPQKSLFARIFGGGAKDREEAADEETTAALPKRSRAATQVASLAAPKPVATTPIVPLPSARPKGLAVAAAAPKDKPDDRIVTAALAARSDLKTDPKTPAFDARGVWVSPIEQSELPAAQDASPFKVAAAEPAADEAAPLAYAAADGVPPPAARARPMGKAMPQVARETPAMTAAPALAAMKAPPMALGGQRADTPWRRAAVLTPSVSAMTVTRM